MSERYKVSGFPAVLVLSTTSNANYLSLASTFDLNLLLPRLLGLSIVMRHRLAVFVATSEIVIAFLNTYSSNQVSCHPFPATSDSYTSKRSMLLSFPLPRLTESHHKQSTPNIPSPKAKPDR